KLYLQGRYGKAPGHVNEEVRKLAIGDLEVTTCRPADLIADELDKLRGEIEGLAKSDEDVLTYAMFPEIGKTWLQERAAGSLKPEQLLPPGASREDSAPRYAADEFKITLHGETYHIKLSGSGRSDAAQRPYFVSIDGVSEEVLVEPLNEVAVSAGSDNTPRKTAAAPAPGQKPRASHPGHVTAAMPGTIVDVLVKIGQTVKAGDGVLVIEAMKMENEVQAPIAGVVISIFCKKGDAVTPDMALVEIQPE
ncbi:MAG: pyruvate carboxylase subunit B, partial [Hydrogenophilales bacterium 12-64-6]